MDIGVITLLLVCALAILLILTGMPIAFVLGFTGVLFTWVFLGASKWISLALTTWYCMNNWAIAACLLFFLMANVLQKSGVVEDLFDTASMWLGFLPGGLAISVVIVCAIIAAMSGVAAAGVVLMGLLVIPEMLQRGYSKNISIGCVAAGGPLGVLIPPSTYFIFWGAFTGVSIGKLFMGGVFPGLLLTGLFALYIGIRCFINPSLGPPVKREVPVTLLEKLISLKAIIFPLILVFLVLGTIYLGICTPTEASAMGAMGAILCAASKGRLTWKMMRESAKGALILNGMVMWLYFCGSIFSQSLTSAGIISGAVKILVGLGLGKWGILILMQATFVVLGMFIDGICMVLVTMPFFFPLAMKLGFDPVWFGVLYIMNTQIGYLSPPFGFSLFYLKSVVPEGVTFSDIIRSVFPFMALQIVGLVIVMLLPSIATWFPGLLIRG